MQYNLCPRRKQRLWTIFHPPNPWSRMDHTNHFILNTFMNCSHHSNHKKGKQAVKICGCCNLRILCNLWLALYLHSFVNYFEKIFLLWWKGGIKKFRPLIHEIVDMYYVSKDRTSQNFIKPRVPKNLTAH